MRELSKQEMKKIKGGGLLTCTGEAIFICECNGVDEEVHAPCIELGGGCTAYCGAPECAWVRTIVGCAQ
jgi:hypothetical protein